MNAKISLVYALRDDEACFPENPDIRWTWADDDRAVFEGWMLCDSGDGIEIEFVPSDDELERSRFASDEEAVDYVALCASEGSELHTRALEIHLADRNGRHASP